MDQKASFVLAVVFCFCLFVVHAEAFDCYSCSYTISGDPSVDYVCANDSKAASKALLPCQTPNQCYTKAVFNLERTQVRSVYRSCYPPQELCTGANCCAMEGVYPACEQKCRTELCNSLNVESWLLEPTTKSPKGAASSFKTNSWLIMCSVSLYLRLL
ncbi:uncharacterized protein LOC128235010 [Mya arenaria]|uniref:uncharacterized protein LOC128235010 n=1 Tax=Mya arenaria TaxID=6604 RepID=UPI0022E827B0|nr:uncharacterized protein LOC128235010 [Mya arenaria]XP_052805646.1 uncharacterized protein LOC128235010 [Mya arenaria]